MANFEQQVRDAQAKKLTGSAPRFKAIDGVGQKTADKLRSVTGVRAPTDAADYTADELADAAGISTTRAETVIRGGGGRPDMAEGSRETHRSVEAGDLADAMDERGRRAAETVAERRDTFGSVIEIGGKIPDDRARRRGDFGPLNDADPEQVRELGRAAETYREATSDPIDPTEDRQTFGFDTEQARDRAGTVSVAAMDFLKQKEGVDFDDAHSQVVGEQVDVGTVEQTTGSLLGGPKRSAGGGFFTTAPTQPTDIGREADGEFARPESSPDIAPAPIDRDAGTGRFGLDPFDITAGVGGGAGGGVESREIEYGGEQVDLTERDTGELENMNEFLSQNVDAEVEAQRAKGGFGTSDFAQEYSQKQTQVALELDQRRG